MRRDKGLHCTGHNRSQVPPRHLSKNTAENIKKGGCTLVKTYLRKGKKTLEREEEGTTEGTAEEMRE